MTNKTCSEPLAAEAVAGNEDLMRQIFFLLPVRLLIRFKSVSKHWCSLISNPKFGLEHTNCTNPTSSGLFFYNSLTKSQEIETVSLLQVEHRVPSLSFLDTPAAGATIKLLQSCNGLLLCSFTSQFSDNEVKNYCVCNPTTNNYTILPQPNLIPPEKVFYCSLAFDPSQSPHYKVVCVKGTYRFRDIDIYSSESGIWTTSRYRMEAPCNTDLDRGVYWNGSIHWISLGFRKNYMVEFDINEETSKLIEMPPKPQSYCFHTLRYFGECRDHLHLIYVRSRTAQVFHVLERDRNTFKWSVKYKVHIRRFISPFPEVVRKNIGWPIECTEPLEYAFSILCVIKGEREEDSALVVTIPGKVISYNFHHKTVKILCELPSHVVDTSAYHHITGFHYIGSLVSL